MVSHWSLNDHKSPHISRTLLSILADLNDVVVWMVSTRPVISKPSSPFNNSSVSVPRAPITIGIIVTFMFHSFFNSLVSSRYLSLFSHSFNLTLWSTILKVLFYNNDNNKEEEEEEEEEIWCHSDSCERPSTNAGVKNFLYNLNNL